MESKRKEYALEGLSRSVEDIGVKHTSEITDDTVHVYDNNDVIHLAQKSTAHTDV